MNSKTRQTNIDCELKRNKMSGRLNLYGDYIDIGTAEGVKLVNNAIHNFKSSLIGTIKLTAEHAPKFIRAIRELGSQYGYEFDLKNLPTV